MAKGIGLRGNPKTTAAAMAAGAFGCELVGENRSWHKFDGRIYTGFPRFNFNDRLAKDLATDGIDVVSTANNHAMDRCNRGINRTLSSLRAAGIRWTGTRQMVTSPWHASTNAKGITVAWLGCTSAGSPLQKEWNANSFAVLSCDNTNAITKMVKELKKSHDAVVVLPHWGKEYASEHESSQKDQAHAWLEAGALAVIGNHPHVTQQSEAYLTRNGRKTLIAYSLGNFVSHQGWRTVGVTPKGELAKRSSPFVLLGLKKTCRNSRCKTSLEDWKYVPLFVWRQGAARCSGCKCPKPLGESILKAKQRCPQFRVMASDRSTSRLGKDAFELVQSRMGPFQSLKYDEAIQWVRARKQAPTPAPTPAPAPSLRCPSFARSRTPEAYNGKLTCKCKPGATCYKSTGRSTKHCPGTNGAKWKYRFFQDCSACRCRRMD